MMFGACTGTGTGIGIGIGTGICIGMLTFAAAEPMYHFATNPDVITGEAAHRLPSTSTAPACGRSHSRMTSGTGAVRRFSALARRVPPLLRRV